MKEENTPQNTKDQTSKENISNSKPPQEQGGAPKLSKLILFAFLALTLIVLSSFFTFRFFCGESDDGAKLPSNPFKNLTKADFELGKFSSEEEFKDYLSKVGRQGYGSIGMGMLNTSMVSPMEEVDLSVAAPGKSLEGFGGGPSRTSTTNVQVAGIDEPDIVKVSGETLFTSFSTSRSRVQPVLERDEMDSLSSFPGVQNQNFNTTKIINAFPPEELENIGGIEEIGKLLVYKDTLVIFTTDTVYGYDISDKTDPEEVWDISYEEKTQYKDARLYNGEIYLVTNTRINFSDPCPIEPILFGQEGFSISCTDIYRPKQVVPTDTTFAVFKIDTESGEIKDSVSFVGNGSESLIYMSQDNLYVTHSYGEDYVGIFSKFINEEASNLFNEEVRDKLERLASYELSNETKMMEMGIIIESYSTSLSEDEAMRFENELENSMDDFMKRHIREFQSTGLMKVSLKNLRLEATGKVPGHPLNQFSLDEYKGNLRIATNSGGINLWSSMGDVNDVYVLGRNLKELGSVKDLGKDEKIYSVRFIADKGYVVTFREVDPFYVLDLSNANNPALKGELKIPGYSSYLHPIHEDLILGTGKEGSKVKISLFDVSDPENPEEVDKYLLDEYWSDILNTHHAFLLDDAHEIFFLPGRKGGYVFSYAGDNELSLKRTVSSIGVKRAVYIDDYLYVVGEQEIIVLDENSWEEVNTFEF